MLGVEHHGTRRRDARSIVAAFCLGLVYCRRARPDPGANVRKADGFQEPLDGTVLAELAVERQKGHVELPLHQGNKVVFVRRVENGYLEPGFQKGLLRPFTGSKGNGALPAFAAGKKSNAYFFRIERTRHSSRFHIGKPGVCAPIGFR